jgi:hypothetical protein
MKSKFHVHDCNCCNYLGSEQKDDGGFDYYYCGDSVRPTVIARFGVAGDYYSSLDHVKHVANELLNKTGLTTLSQAIEVLKTTERKDEHLLEAAHRAVKANWLDENLNPVKFRINKKMKF